jgi:hypothetical protein
MSLKQAILHAEILLKGGAGSGNFGHAGRSGEVGGSGGGGGGGSEPTNKEKAQSVFTQSNKAENMKSVHSTVSRRAFRASAMAASDTFRNDITPRGKRLHGEAAMAHRAAQKVHENDPRFSAAHGAVAQAHEQIAYGSK